MKCNKCKSKKIIETKEGKLVCQKCGEVSIRKQGNFITRMFIK